MSQVDAHIDRDVAAAIATALAEMAETETALAVDEPHDSLTGIVAEGDVHVVAVDYAGSRTGTAAVLVGADLAATLTAAGADLVAGIGPVVAALAERAGGGADAGASVGEAAEREVGALASPGVEVIAYPIVDDAGTAVGAVLVTTASSTESVAVAPHEFPPITGGGGGQVAAHPLSLLQDVEMGVTAELGRRRMTVRELLSLTPGAVIELDRAAGSPVDVLVNGTLIARGEVVVIDEEFGIRISEIITDAANAPTH
jgi:flagellar motor switch protein FliN/FliY